MQAWCDVCVDVISLEYVLMRLCGIWFDVIFVLTALSCITGLCEICSFVLSDFTRLYDICPCCTVRIYQPVSCLSLLYCQFIPDCVISVLAVLSCCQPISCLSLLYGQVIRLYDICSGCTVSFHRTCMGRSIWMRENNDGVICIILGSRLVCELMIVHSLIVDPAALVTFIKSVCGQPSKLKIEKNCVSSVCRACDHRRWCNRHCIIRLLQSLNWCNCHFFDLQYRCCDILA